MAGALDHEHLERVRFTRALNERRDWERVQARDRKAWLAWKDENGPQLHQAELVNISGGGASLQMARVPPRGRGLRLRLESLETVEVESLLVEGRRHRTITGIHVIRIRFTTECPTSLFERAIHGRSD
jgi:hypothetical protein